MVPVKWSMLFEPARNIRVWHVVVHVESHRVNVTFSPRHDQTRVQGVSLCVLLPLSGLVHMRPHAEDVLVANSDSGLYANGVVLNGPRSRRQTLDLSTYSIPGGKKGENTVLVRMINVEAEVSKQTFIFWLMRVD